MWAGVITPLQEGMPLKRLVLNFLVALLTTLFATFLVAPMAHAADGAAWDSGYLVYDDNKYEGPSTSSAEFEKQTSIPEGSEYYSLIENAERDGDPATVKILYFTPGTDKADASSAQYREYKYDTSKSLDGEYSQQGGAQSVSVDQGTYESNGAREETSCAIDGIGYIICPIVNTVAEFTDWVFGLLKSMLHVAPLYDDTKAGLYQAWSLARWIAMVCFVIAFVVIVYSYITGMGVKQYDIRKMIPRLIIAAVLVNSSYIICALAVDLSNIFGASLQDMFMNISNQLQSNSDTVSDKGTFGLFSWTTLATLVLSAGTIGAGAAALATFGSGALWLFMPLVTMAGLAVFIALVVIAARQAIITILIILAPIALSAFVLPSTQKWFDKWQNVFTTLLVLYPMFSLLFGGSQLAANLIMQNATGLLTVLFAMAVQVVPLVITPFLIKLSGGLIGKIAGIVNNPMRGPMDRLNNHAKERAGLHKAKRLADPELKGFGINAVRKHAYKNMADEADKKRYDEDHHAMFMRSARGRQIYQAQQESSMRSSMTENNNKAEWAERQVSDNAMRALTVQSHLAEDSLKTREKDRDAYVAEISTKAGAAIHAASGDKVAAVLSDKLIKTAEENMALDSRKAMAEKKHRSEYADEVLLRDELAVKAGGILGETGKSLALATATQAIRKDFGEGSAAQRELLNHFAAELDNSALERLAHGGVATGFDSNGRGYTFDTTGDNIGGELHEAAVAKFLAETNYDGARKLIKAASDGVEDGVDKWAGIHSTVKEGVLKTHASKAPFLSGQALDRIDQGLATSGAGFNQNIIDYIQKGKFSGKKLALDTDAVALEDMYKVVLAAKQGKIKEKLGPYVKVDDDFDVHVDEFIEAVRDAMADPLYKGEITGTNKEKLLAIKHAGSPRRL